MMEAWVGLVGAVGATIGQHYLGRRDRVDSYKDEVLMLCAQVVALSEDFRNRVWEERTGVADDVLASWDVSNYKLAEARLRILSSDSDLQGALRDLRKTGQRLGVAWRTADGDSRVEVEWRAHKETLDRFVDVSAAIAEKYHRRQ